MSQKDPLIIAMKGHPGTGKSTLASYLASSLSLPLIDKDDIRDSTLPVQEALGLASSASRLLNDLSYDAMWRIASTQLRHGLGAIIDSPLSRKTHLNRLESMATAYHARLIIVECRPSNEAVWRMRLQGRATGDNGGGWHKPSTWADIERLLEGYGGCTEYEIGDVPRIVVDTTEPGARIEDTASAVMEFIASHGGCS
ncbi:hypothetical protein SAY87_020187 [Trapa incisa]|uniref:P-loop containing nucleoside triphosphate hydrolase protein n=1 Tax=Trapa incisa TaxID=236973 RepID=A0AAN7K669_9MYRT|nr:hypothetical protein SAY87_020187 [Trapa incisa]